MLDFLTRNLSLLAEGGLIVIVAAILFTARRPVLRWICSKQRWVDLVVQRQWLAVVLVGLLAFCASAALSFFWGVPIPQVHDEFSYLLGADTFAQGRLSNPTHPLWVHFESFHIIHQPTYASKYPPAQALSLALGQVIGGHPVVGVWISTAFALAALCWMLWAWVPPRWALLGSMLALVHPGILIQWGQSYWGGTVAMAGGAIVFGALRRVLSRPHILNALLLGLGIVILANSRPYEGMVASLPVAVVLLGWILGKNRPVLTVTLGRVLLPVALVLCLAAIVMGIYNQRVTGHPLRLAYTAHEETYALAPNFLWQDLRSQPSYRHAVMQEYNTGWSFERYDQQRSLSGWLVGARQKIVNLWRFYYGYPEGVRLAVIIPFLMLPWVIRSRWSQLALLVWGAVMLALFLIPWRAPHYSAPITSLVCVLLLQGMRCLQVWRLRSAPIGRALAQAVLIVTLGSFAVVFLQQMPRKTAAWAVERARILRQLTVTPERHLVIVRYRPEHSPLKEWVYNEADIDGAKVVWAREMDPTQNRKLLEYFQDRRVWLLTIEADDLPVKLLPYQLEAQPLLEDDVNGYSG